MRKSFWTERLVNVELGGGRRLALAWGVWRGLLVYLHWGVWKGKQHVVSETRNTNASDNGQFQRWPRPQGQTFLYQKKDLVTRNDHGQCGISNINYLEVMTNVRFFKKLSNVMVKRLSTNGEIFSKEISLWNIKALALNI